MNIEWDNWHKFSLYDESIVGSLEMTTQIGQVSLVRNERNIKG